MVRWTTFLTSKSLTESFNTGNAFEEHTLSYVQVTNKALIYEEQRLQIEELDEWRTQKSRTHDKPKPRHNGLNVLSNQLKVGDEVLLDAADPHITPSEPMEQSLLRYLPFSHMV
ncbi:hypothetical protein GOBAR_AA18735 [Gossypium barbadense]|uniref:Uncharacterized protein n=1 Tax=Gossypium barbadense TaxID=3634 RepID=A0A2P5XF25_GOSBA|nr:hypothetical protein GOBAR_AA18735 [Gossypium barbadense]